MVTEFPQLFGKVRSEVSFALKPETDAANDPLSKFSLHEMNNIPIKIIINFTFFISFFSLRINSLLHKNQEQSQYVEDKFLQL